MASSHAAHATVARASGRAGPGVQHLAPAPKVARLQAGRPSTRSASRCFCGYVLKASNFSESRSHNFGT